MEGATREFEAALGLEADNVEAQAGLGSALLAQGDLPGAISQFRKALESKPDYAAAHYNLAIAFETGRDLKAAAQEYRAAYQLDPHDPAIRSALRRSEGHDFTDDV